jgi:hypothetical protein
MHQITDQTTSLNGLKLEQPISFTFSTPAPSIYNVSPANLYGNGLVESLFSSTEHSATMTLDPIIFVVFDQQVDTDTVYKSTFLVNLFGMSLGSLRKATYEEITADESLTPYVKDQQFNGRYVAFKMATGPLPKSQLCYIKLTLVPSAEGPAISRNLFSKFRTYAPLKIVSRHPKGRLHPGEQTLSFSFKYGWYSLFFNLYKPQSKSNYF